MCGKDVTEDGWHGLSRLKIAGRFTRHSNLNNPGMAAAEAEERKIDKYKDLVNDGYLFQPLAFEIQGAAGPSTEFF